MRALTAEGVEKREIRHRMSAVYGVHSMSYKSVLERQKRFREGCVPLEEDAQH